MTMTRRPMRYAMLLCLLAVLPANAEKRSVEQYLDAMKSGLSDDVVEELGQDLETAKAVIKAARDNSQFRLRDSCMFLAVRLSRPELAEEVKPYLKDAHPRVRQDAMVALSGSIGEESLPLLEPLADDPDPFTRVVAMSEMAKATGSKRGPRVKLHPLLKRKLNDSNASVKLTAGLLLASDEVSVPRKLALDHIADPRQGYLSPRSDAISLLGFVGNNDDFVLLQGILAQKIGFGKTEARKSIQQLRVTLAKSANEKNVILEAGFRDLQDWAGPEAVRRYRLGDDQIRDMVRRIAEDSKHPGKRAAIGALELIERMK